MLLAKPFRPSQFKKSNVFLTLLEGHKSIHIVKNTPTLIIKILICFLVFLMISPKVKAYKSDETITEKQKEEAPVPKTKDKLWKRIIKEILSILGFFKDEVEEDPLALDPKFLVWKILLKLFLLTVLYTTRRRQPEEMKPMCYSYAIYLIVTLVMWLQKCYEAFLYHLYPEDYIHFYQEHYRTEL